jgi:hypothetical protein
VSAAEPVVDGRRDSFGSQFLVLPQFEIGTLDLTHPDRMPISGYLADNPFLTPPTFSGGMQPCLAAQAIDRAIPISLRS